MMNKWVYLLLASAILTVGCQRSQTVPLQTGLQSPSQLRSGSILRSQSDRGLAQMGKEVRTLIFSYFVDILPGLYPQRGTKKRRGFSSGRLPPA